MVTVPLEWTIKINGGQEVKTTLNDLNEAFKRGTINREEYNKALARGNRVAAQSLNVDRYQANITKAQFPNLMKVSRAMSTVTSISRSLLTISNALNISKIANNTQDISMMETQAELNILKRERNELEANGLKGGKRWLEVVEQINIKEAELKEKNQALIDQKWDGMLTQIETVFFGIGTIFSNLINNPTILKALMKAGGFFGGVFAGFFQLISNTAIKAGGWIASALGLGSPAAKGAALAGSRMGTIFGLSFAGAASVAIIAIGAAILAGAIDIMMENVSGQSFVRSLTEKLLGKGKGMSVKDILGINEYKGADLSGQGIFGGPKSYQDYIKDYEGKKKPMIEKKEIDEQVSFFQPLIDLFTIGIPDALKILQEGFTNGWKGITEMTNSFGANLVAGVNSIFKSLIDSMNKAISSYNKAAKKMGKSTISSLSFTPNTFTPIPLPSVKAATGFDGMVNRPTMFLAGEAGPEQVSITPNGRSSGGNTVIIHVAGSIVTEKKIAYMVDQYQKQNLKSRGFTGFG